MHYVVKRLIAAIPLIIGITFLSFMIMKMAPGDPVSNYMDPQMGKEDMAQIRENLGFDDPLLLQYGKWLKEVCKGNLGFSFVSGQNVMSAILQRLPATLILSMSSLVLILMITLPLGLLSGYKKGSVFDDSVTVFTFVGLSIPAFWLGLIFILGFSLKLDLFPTSGFLDPELMGSSMISQVLNIAHHLFLPLLTILVGGIASLTRYHRFGIISILSQDYITCARARGLSETRILYKHAFKNAALPIITILGLSLPDLIGGSFIIEYIFSWPGMGQLGVNAIFARDYPIIMGTLLFTSVLIILGNLCADIAYAMVDPRIRKPS
ncbi:MAG: ABC transporter permease [Candidatus Margulisbacteria bacterium]|nr:ABC transporter permease [Candidatus Margulisiibacteriota bacterium]